ncbi:MAG: 4Fe-4S dicluster domain-containing protein [Pseudomonadota bacterium]
MGILWGTVQKDGYRPSLIYRLFRPRNITGNEINGLGETELRRATPIYHWFGILKLPFNRVWWLLIAYTSLKGGKRTQELMDGCRAYADKPYDPLAVRQVIKSPETWTADIKQFALDHGAEHVGVLKVRDEWIFEGQEVSEKWIIILGLKMNYSELSQSPSQIGTAAAIQTYFDSNVLCHRISNWLRAQGWEARGYGGPMASAVLAVPVALAAGFGQLGKHGSIISNQVGANLRLAYVLTDIPLVEEDTPIDFGVDNFCLNCQVCTEICPPGAISPEKQMVRGVEKWYVNFDKCVPFFNDTGGCGACIASCPWSNPDNLPIMLPKMEQQKRKEDILSIQ